ncbi:MAG: ATP-binding protein, partial [Bacteroidota bacterium]
ELYTKDREIKEANTAKHTMSILIYALLGLISAGIIIAVLLIRNREKKRQLREAELQHELEQNRQNLISTLNRHEIEALSKVIEGQEMEKRRIAAELHDAIGGTMAALKMNFAFILNAIKMEAPDLKEPFEQTHQMLTSAVQEVRGLSHQMSAKPLMNASLYGAVHEMGENISIGADFELYLDIESIRKVEVPSHIKLHLYRIIQEAFQNIIKYASASTVNLSIHIRKDVLLMEVKDDGIGFTYVKDQPLPGIGLNNIQRRVLQMDGDWQLTTSRDKGVRIWVEVPLKREHEEELLLDS